MKPKSIIKTGIIGVGIAALCCFTPILVLLLGAVGLSALVGYLDFILLPALLIFFAIAYSDEIGTLIQSKSAGDSDSNRHPIGAERR